MKPNDDAYNNRGYIPGGDDYPDRWAEEARQFREMEAAVGRARLNTAYGPHGREKFDLFHPAGRAEGLVVFIHGGYWRLFDRSYWSHFARGCTARGWAVAMPSYPLAPEVGIDAITRAARAAVLAASGMVPVRLVRWTGSGRRLPMAKPHPRTPSAPQDARLPNARSAQSAPEPFPKQPTPPLAPRV
ncbi:MAG: hypothetical protein AAFR34_03960 [Pseudomonadota bacterium]